MFVRDGRTMPFVPVTLVALDAIKAVTPTRRLPFARICTSRFLSCRTRTALTARRLPGRC